uniref:Secreted protein n=1 Tax=Cacopsylla melanoneura TaxID=428564 RepID=A0A8D9AEG3_9HEMI
MLPSLFFLHISPLSLSFYQHFIQLDQIQFRTLFIFPKSVANFHQNIPQLFIAPELVAQIQIREQNIGHRFHVRLVIVLDKQRLGDVAPLEVGQRVTEIQLAVLV